MKTLIALSLILASGSAMAATADLVGNLKSFKVVGKLLCKDATPLMAEDNIKRGINILIYASAAEEAEKKGDLETVAKAKEAIEQVVKGSEAITAEFNTKCVNGDAVFAETADATGAEK